MRLDHLLSRETYPLTSQWGAPAASVLPVYRTLLLLYLCMGVGELDLDSRIWMEKIKEVKVLRAHGGCLGTDGR